MLKPVSNNNAQIVQPNFETIPVIKFASLDESEWLIDDILPKGELAVIFGEPGCGKTFLALGLSMAIARGIEWERKEVVKGRIVYICAEGAHGFKKRALAYLLHNKLDMSQNIDFDVIPNSPDFLADFDAGLIATSILKNGPASVIVVDTFSSVMPGGSEGSDDMGTAIRQCKKLHQLTGAIVVLIHHSGKDSTKGARGWSGLLGACDTEIEVKKLSNGHKAKITKQKDGEMGQEWGFDLRVVELGTNSKGKMITSCVYESTNSIPLETNNKKNELPDSLKVIMDAFKAFESPYVPEADLIHQVVSRRTWDKIEGKRDTRRQLVVRALNDLYDRKVLKSINDLVSIY